MVNKPTLHRGKLAKAPKILAVRALTREDLASLKTAPRTVPRVKGFRETHHRLARLVAAGLRNEEILRITGFSYGRLITLRQDPAFIELVAQYRPHVDASYARSLDEFYETATSNMLRAERQIEEHFDAADDSGELLPIKTLLAVTSDRADRFGYSKKTINTNVNIDLAKKMEQMMAARGQSAVIDAPVRQIEASPARVPRGSQNSAEVDPSVTPDYARAGPDSAPRAGFRRRM